MTEVSLAWLETKVTSPIVGPTKMHHVEGAVNSVDLSLSSDDIEEIYTIYKLRKEWFNLNFSFFKAFNS